MFFLVYHLLQAVRSCQQAINGVQSGLMSISTALGKTERGAIASAYTQSYRFLSYVHGISIVCVKQWSQRCVEQQSLMGTLSSWGTIPQMSEQLRHYLKSIPRLCPQRSPSEPKSLGGEERAKFMETTLAVNSPENDRLW